MRTVHSVVVALALTLVACAEPGEATGSDPTQNAWELESGSLDETTIRLVEGHPITLSFGADGDGVVGTAACNGYGGSFSISGDELELSELSQTAMACEPEETMESEAMYLEALGRVETYTTTDETLMLAGDGVDLVFVALPPAPISQLTGTVWVLDGLVQGDTVSSVAGERATLELFSDGSMLGSTGCRTLNGSYLISGAEVVLNELAAKGECPPDLHEQDGQVVTVLGDGFRARIDEDILTVTSVGDEGLIYRAES